MIDGADGYNTFTSERFVKRARKPHRCQECRRAIAIGDSCHYQSALFEGDISDGYTCVHCHVAGEWLSTNCGGYLVGSMCEDIAEHVQEYAAAKPKCMSGLRLLLLGMRQQWTVKQGPYTGRLRAIPALPPKLEPVAKAA